MATLKEIADSVGISVSTASMAVRDHRSISIETKRKVWEAQEKLGYKLHLKPRQSSRRQNETEEDTKNIAFLLVDREFDDPAYSRTFQGVAKGVSMRDWRSIFVSATLQEMRAGEFPSAIKNREVDGIIVTGLYDEVAHEKLSSLGIPMITLGNYRLGDEPWAACELDLACGMRLLMGRLGEQNHRRFGLLLRNGKTEYEQQLRQCYLREISVRNYENVEIGMECENGSLRNAIRHVLDSPVRPTALILASDTFSEEVYDVCDTLKLKIPADISIAGFGDGRHIVRPSLATIQTQGQDLGMAALEKLARNIENPDIFPTRELFPMSLVPGGSMDFARGFSGSNS